MIYLITKGYPRKIVMLCSKVIISLLVHNKKKSGPILVTKCAKETSMFSYASVVKAFGLAGLFGLSTAILIFGVITLLNFNTERNNELVSKHNDLKNIVAEVKPAAFSPNKPEIALKEELSQANTDTQNDTSLEKSETLTKQDSLIFGFDSQSHALIPESLGAVRFDSQVTLSKMIARIYGRYKTKRLHRLLEVNPHITDPDHVSKHTLVKFPKEEYPRFTPSQGQFWVELTRTANLADAYDLVKNMSDSTLSVLIVPAIQNKTDLIFVIVLDDTFTDKMDAETNLSKISQNLRKSAIIRQG